MMDVSFSGATNSNLMIFVIVIASFVLVSLWHTAIELIYYDLFNYDRTSPLDAMFLAIVFTAFVIMVAMCMRVQNKEDE